MFAQCVWLFDHKSLIPPAQIINHLQWDQDELYLLYKAHPDPTGKN